jgi:uncharacterized repeat protein (TIGR01451 family)
MFTIRCIGSRRLISFAWVSLLLALWLSPLTAGAANLFGLNVAPQNPTTHAGESIQLSAIGSYDDATQLVIAQAKQISSGNRFSCAVTTGGAIKCWGKNDYGQLGNDTTTDSSAPTTVNGITNAVSVSSRFNHACALLADGSIKCWGANNVGQLGNGTLINSSLPVAVNGISTAVNVSAGANHTCAVLASGTLMCWGNNYSGELGNGTFTNSSTPVQVSGITTALSVSAGPSHSCAVLADNSDVVCWGSNSAGQLGFPAGPTCSPASGPDCHQYANPRPVLVNTKCGCFTDYVIRKQAVSVSSGASYTCAVYSELKVDVSPAVFLGNYAMCWGYNQDGVLGDGTTTPRYTPRSVSGISTAVSIDAGNNHACASLTDGTVKCWGNNFTGQLGDGTTKQSSTPVFVAGITSSLGITAGNGHSCAVQGDGTVKCWGDNQSGQIGIGSVANPNVPQPVNGVDLVTDVSIAKSSYYHACAVLANGTVDCWGNNYYGQLGNGVTSSVQSLYSGQSLVTGIVNAMSISAGVTHTCALLADGTIKCWGSNLYGQLGNGSLVASSTPVTVAGISTAVAVKSGGYHTCALLSDGTVRCWGYNNYGQLGNGSYTNSSVPVALMGIVTAAQNIDAGEYHSCALLTDRTLSCWGSNAYSQIGTGTNFTVGSYSTPVAVIDISTAIQVSAGSSHTCALLMDGTIKCWGINFQGELGNGTSGYFMTNPTPGLVSGITTAVSIANTCAVLADGTVSCWGLNYNGTYYVVNNVPVPMSGVANAVGVRKGSKFYCVTFAGGVVNCWGDMEAMYTGVFGVPTSAPVSSLGFSAIGWNSDNPGIASVNGIGQVLGVTPGVAQIVASAAGFTDSTPLTVIAASSDLQLRLKATPASVLQTQSITYTLSVVNNGPSAATGVVASGSLYTCTIGNLAVGVAANCTYPVTATTVGTLTQTMSVSGNETDPNSANNTASVSTTVNPTANLAVSLVAPSSVLLGQTITYTTTVTNNGPSPATGVTASGDLPTCALGDLAVGAKASCTSTVAASTLGAVTRKMHAVANEGTTLLGNYVFVTTTVNPAADLGLSLTATPGSVLQGGTVSYTVSVTNNGPSPATGVVVTGTLPTCTIGILASGASASCTSTVTATTVGALTQTMTVSGNETDPNTANNSSSVSTTVNPSTAADLNLTLTDSPDPVKKGAKLAYTVTVKNNGPQTAHNVSLTDTLPANIVFEQVTTTRGSCSGTATVTCALGTIASGATAKVTITIKPQTVGTIINRATVSATEGDPNTGNNSTTATTVVKK